MEYCFRWYTIFDTKEITFEEECFVLQQGKSGRRGRAGVGRVAIFRLYICKVVDPVTDRYLVVDNLN